MEKIKAFFNKKMVKIVGGIAVVIAATALTICGIRTKEVVPQVTTVAVGVLAGAAGAVTIVKGITIKKEEQS
jgi:hypothetical protein